MKTCNQDCDQGRTCNCSTVQISKDLYDAWVMDVAMYVILMVACGIIGFIAGVLSCS